MCGLPESKKDAWLIGLCVKKPAGIASQSSGTQPPSGLDSAAVRRRLESVSTEPRRIGSVEVLEDGAPGEIIHVRNQTSQRNLAGRVLDDQTVLISL